MILFTQINPWIYHSDIYISATPIIAQKEGRLAFSKVVLIALKPSKAAAPFMRSRYHRITLAACSHIHFWLFVAPLMRSRSFCRALWMHDPDLNNSFCI